MPEKSSKTTNLWEMFLADEELHDVWHEPRHVARHEDADDRDGDFGQPDVAFLDLLLAICCVFDAAADRSTKDVSASLKTQASMLLK